MSNFECELSLLDFLRAKFKDRSVRSLKKLIENGSCLVNGFVEKICTTKITVNDRIDIDLQGKKQELTIVFEDEDLLLCNKPSGIISDQKTFKAKFPKYRLLNRLDKETSGLIFVAKTSRIITPMIELFQKEQILKKYLALCWGIPKNEKGIIEKSLKEIQLRPGCKKVIVSEKGDRAVTHWEKLAQGEKVSLLECSLITGRTHQIRVHLAHIGLPIIGDSLYSQSKTPSIKRQLLHSYKVKFLQPLTKNEVEVECPPPEDFLQAEKRFIWNHS